MEITEILSRFTEGLPSVDKHTSHQSSNQRTGEVYLPGVKTMSEPKFVEEFLTLKATCPTLGHMADKFC